MNSASLNIEKLIPKFRVLPYFRESNVIALVVVTWERERERERECSLDVSCETIFMPQLIFLFS